VSARSHRFGAVIRFYELKLEAARIGLVTADARLDEQRALQKAIQERADEARSVAQKSLQSASGVSADELRQWGSYASWNLQRLEEQRKRVREAEEAAEQALRDVTRCFQALSAIEKLSERREREAALEAARADQKALDEHALARAARLIAPASHL
jgi:flagellar export protein FliJ